jgi:hypothetical protein
MFSLICIVCKYEQLEEMRRSCKSPFLQFNPVERRFSLTSSKAVSTSSSEEDDEHSDTSLHLGYVTSFHDYNISQYSLITPSLIVCPMFSFSSFDLAIIQES